MNMEQIWNCETPVAELLGCDAPLWIEQDISPYTVASICTGGCASGAYMPAVTYYQATRTMSEHGDVVLDYIQDSFGELPAPPQDSSWSGMACFYLSFAVELWASDVMFVLESYDLEADGDCD